MKIGIRAHDMERAPLEELVQNINKKGFQCTQLALQKAIDEFNVDKEALTPGLAFYIRDIFRKYNVDIAVLGCYLNMANPDNIERKDTLDTYKAHIRFASLLGCGMVGTETGAVNREYRYEEANHSEKALQILIENLKYVVEYGEKMGVIIGMEPVFFHIVSDIERTYKVIQAVNSPNLQIIFDPVNLLSYQNYKNQEDIMKGAFELFGKDIAAIHAKDFKVEGQEIRSYVSGEGLLNYGLLLSLIKKHKPYIHVLLEDTTPSNVLQTKEFVENAYKTV